MPIATALIVAGTAYYATKKVKNDADGEDDESNGPPPDITSDFLHDKTCIELLPLEQSLTVLEWPISTVSFYQFTSEDGGGSDAVHLTATLHKIEKRVHAILAANPWLGGWLVRGNGVGRLYDKAPRGPPRLWYDPSGKEMASNIFQKVSRSDVPLHRNTPYEDYESILYGTGVTVKTNPEIENRKEEPLFRVSVIVPSSNKEKMSWPYESEGDKDGFAIVMSMSHICGDGHTYYRLYNMLVGSEPIVALTPARELSYSSKVKDLMGQQEAHYVQHLTTDPAWMKLFRSWESNGSKTNGDEDDIEGMSELHGRVFSVNRHWIGNIKASYMTEGNFAEVCSSTLRSPMAPSSLKELEGSSGENKNTTISTNDILCSHFWNLVKPNVGLMTVNFRGRVDCDISTNHAGNYVNPIPYIGGDDYKNPELIRKSLENCRRAGVVEDGGPTVLPRPSSELTFSIITNWSSFLSSTHRGSEQLVKEENDGDGLDWNNGQYIKLVLHLPIVYTKRMIKDMPRGMSFMIIFSCSEEEIGCMLIAPGRVMEEIDTCGVVMESIAQF